MNDKVKKLHVKRDDEVIVISGDDRGKRGKVVETSPSEGKIIVSGVNVVSKHTKPRKQGESGGIIKVDGPIYADKVMLYCSKCGKGVRAAYKFKDGKKFRACAKCGDAL